MEIGPWEYRQLNPKDIKIFREGDRPSSGCIASVPLRDGRTLTGLCHAALIAAAPDLLEALKLILLETNGPVGYTPYSPDSYLPQPLLERAREALDKAGAIG